MSKISKLLSALELFLFEKNISKKDVCLIGSATLLNLGYENINDLEIVLKPNVRERLISKDNCLVINSFSNTITITKKIECQKDPFIMFDISDEDLFLDMYSYIFHNYHIVNKEIYLARKILTNRDKDLEHIAIFRGLGYFNDKDLNKAYGLIDISDRLGWANPSINKEKRWNDIICDSRKKFIFGLGSVAGHVYNRFVYTNTLDSLAGFITSETNSLNDEKYGKPILVVDLVNDKDCIILLAVSFQYMVREMETLKKKGFINIIQSYEFYL